MNETGPLEPAEQSWAETSVDIAAEPDRVWEALVTDGGLEPWMGDGATIDPTPGGRLILPDVVGGRPRAGRVEQVERQHRLVFTWWPITRPADRSTVSITVVPIDTGTRVTVREAPMAPMVASAAEACLAGDLTTAGSRPAPCDPYSVIPKARFAAGSLRGCWAWRLSMLSLSCGAVRV